MSTSINLIKSNNENQMSLNLNNNYFNDDI